MKTLPSVPENQNKLEFIDSLRGVAIIMVIFNHADWYSVNLNTHLQAISDYGQMGVQLFFVVSAYTLCLSMLRRNDESENLKTFYLRRYFRIAPLYYVGIPFYFIYHSFVAPIIEGSAPAISPWYTFENVLVNILLINDFFPGNANTRIVPGGWSIGTETTFYLIFPFILLLYKKFKHSNVVLSIIPLIGLILSLIGLYSLEFFAVDVFDYENFDYFKRNGHFLYYSILCQLPVFLIGMSLFFVTQQKWKATIMDKGFVILTIIAFTFFSFFIFIYRNDLLGLLPFLPAVSFFFLFILFKQVPQLSNKWLARIGQLSFSIYLFHFVIAWEGSRFLNLFLSGTVSSEVIFFMNVVLTTLLTCPVAVLSEKYIEKPGIELGKRLIKRLKSRDAARRLVVE